MAEKASSALGRLVGKVRAVVGMGRDGTLPLPPADAELGQLLSQFAQQAADRPWVASPTQFRAGREILKLPPERRVLVLYAAYTRLITAQARRKVETGHRALCALCGALLRSTLPVTGESLAVMLGTWTRYPDRGQFGFLPIQSIITASGRYVKKHGMTPELEGALRDVRGACEKHRQNADAERAIVTLGELLGESRPAPALRLEGGEAWADAAIADMANMPEGERKAWARLLAYCRTATASHPSKKWLAKAGEHVTAVGAGSFTAHVARWLPLVDRPRTEVLPAPARDWMPDPNALISGKNEQVLKGLAWACATVDDADVARALAECAVGSFRKVRWHGPRCKKLGNACLDALALMPTAEAAAQLSRLSTVVKQPTGKKTVAKAIANLAERTHQSPEDLEELSVPTYDMKTPGVLEQPVGAYAARLEIGGPGGSTATYTSPAGKTQRTVPAEVKRDHPTELKAFQKTAKDAEKMLAAQRVRVERLLMSERSWPTEAWRQRYLGHVLVGPLARRLIWAFTSGKTTVTGICLDGKLVDQAGKEITPPDDAQVRLWHPIGADVELVRAWRAFLQEHRITQPFKQTHREVYILTDAELNTRTYSNRFAAHIIRQHQFRALCEQRGWKAGLVGTWDGGDTTPRLELPRWKLRAEFWVEPTGDDLGRTGTVTYLTTDQVRFYRDGGTRPMSLTEVPATVFSEVMRDVDLFVGVCSVGNDPSWQDSGTAGFRDYWHATSFGDLGASAQTRRELLATLLPKLKIRDRATLTDKFLVVRGDLRTYKIHLGSGNILMDPNDQYLCIVPDRSPGAATEVFLPFEGDSVMAVILSKAFMLASDTKIKDPTITRQIRTR